MRAGAGSGTISKILFANFGTGHLAADCSRGVVGTCAGSNNSMAVVERLCLGKNSCQIGKRPRQHRTRHLMLMMVASMITTIVIIDDITTTTAIITLLRCVECLPTVVIIDVTIITSIITTCGE